MRFYDHIFFDLDHTLWDFEANSRQALMLMLEDSNLINKLPSFNEYLAVYERLNEDLWVDYRARKISKSVLTYRRFKESLEQFGIKDIDAEKLNGSYLHFMAQQTILYPYAIELLDYLKSKRYQMHIITNGFYEVQHKKLNTSKLESYFTKVFVSERIQSPKPERQIFEYAIKSANAKKARSIMIGDNWDVDIVGAFNFGIDQLMFTNNNQYYIPEEIRTQLNACEPEFFIQQKKTKTYFVRELKDIQQIL